MASYINKGNEAFASALRTAYVDKSGLNRRDKQNPVYREAFQLCNPLPPFWKIYGGKDALCLL